MRTKWLLFPTALLCILSCSNKYSRLSKQYTFRTEDKTPHYENLEYWAAHPWKKDLSDSVPAPLGTEKRDSTVDVFFIHPTTFTHGADRHGKNRGNAAIDDPYINARTDYTTILYQASAFNQHARVFAPRYRQADIRNFFEKDKIKAAKNFDFAYADVKTAFLYYLKQWNKGRPFILASHSQGTLLAERLYKELIIDKPLEKQMVAAYLVGWSLLKDEFSKEKLCQDSLQTNCLCGWRTLKRNFIPYFVSGEHGNSWVTNPLSWTTTGERIPKKYNKGSVLLKFNTIYRHTTDAQVEDGLLFVKRPKFPWSFLYLRRNYHVADINLFYINLRHNIEQRIDQFMITNTSEPRH